MTLYSAVVTRRPRVPLSSFERKKKNTISVFASFFYFFSSLIGWAERVWQLGYKIVVSSYCKKCEGWQIRGDFMGFLVTGGEGARVNYQSVSLKASHCIKGKWETRSSRESALS